jgi:hypothetical protein
MPGADFSSGIAFARWEFLQTAWSRAEFPDVDFGRVAFRGRVPWSQLPQSRVMFMGWIIAPPIEVSESRQALRAVVGDGDTGNLL